MKKSEATTLRNEHKHIMTALVTLIVFVFIGLFVYPTIGFQKGETAPLAPSDLVGEAGDGQINLSWTAPADGGSAITDYTVQYNNGAKTFTSQTGSTEASYSLKGLTNGTEYTISVAAENAIGLGSYSRGITATPNPAGGLPGAPTDLAAVAGDSQVSLSWVAPEDIGGSDITTYIVYFDDREIETASSKSSYIVTELTNGDTYSFTVAAKNSSGAGEKTSAVEATPVAVSTPTISSLTVTPGRTSASFVWATDEDSSSQVWYGVVSSDDDGKNTTEINTTPRTKGHTVNVSNLIPCTVYLYKAVSTNASSGRTESEKSTFTTTGCPGDAEVEATQASKITVASGGTISATANGKAVQLVVPAAVASGKSEVFFQTNIIDKTNARTALSLPSGKTSWIGNAVQINALDDADTKVSESFDEYIDVTLEYTDEEVVGLNESSLKIHRHDGTQWYELENCSVDTVNNEITCKTKNFSTFGIFGASSGGGGSAMSYACSDGLDNDKDQLIDYPEDLGCDSPQDTDEVYISCGDPSASNFKPEEVGQVNFSDTSYCQYGDIEGANQESEGLADTGESMTTEDEKDINTPNSFKGLFTQNLWRGVKNAQVKFLQMFLNSQGFTVSEDGFGSPGQETDYFGPKTRQALIMFQEANRVNILSPIGLINGTGFFGPQTRSFINSLE